MNSEILFTWLDVQFVLEELRARAELPAWLMRYTVYPDEAIFEVIPGTTQTDVDAFLGGTFGARSMGNSRIALESSPSHQRSITVNIEETAEERRLTTGSFSPSFRRVIALPDSGGKIPLPPGLAPDGPELVAFYSFKGGVGRTTHLLAYLKAASEQRTQRRALVIDADIEAPGITTLMRNEKSVPEATFSFIDLLSIVQSDQSDGSEEALELAAYMTAKQVFTVTSRDASIEHCFIPAFRSEDQAMRLDIRPEHISSRPGKSWFLANFLSELGKRLHVDIVLIDLRAGFSELASPFLFDSRIRRIIVTTPSSQSLQGTSTILRQLAKV